MLMVDLGSHLGVGAPWTTNSYGWDLTSSCIGSTQPLLAMVDLRALDIVYQGQILRSPTMRLISTASVDWTSASPPADIRLGKGRGSIMVLD